MGRPRKEDRVLGPYPYRGEFRLILVGDDGTRVSRYFEKEEEAWRVRAATERRLNTVNNVAVTHVLTQYKSYMRDEKGNKPRSVEQTMLKLKLFFPETVSFSALTSTRATALYDSFRSRKKKSGKPISVDYHRNTLAEAKTFVNWCVAKKYLKANPFDDVRGVGRRNKGKPQLSRDESRKFLRVAMAEANSGNEMAVASMVALLLGERASEILDRKVRELDDGGKLLIISDSKTKAGRRTLEVPVVLQPYLLKLAKGKKATARLFAAHTPRWLLRNVNRICKEARISVVCTHGLRGTHSTLATEHGVTGHVVAASLGHESVSTTHGHYIDASAASNAKSRRVAAALAVRNGGGNLNNETQNIVVQTESEKRSPRNLNDSGDLSGVMGDRTPDL